MAAKKPGKETILAEFFDEGSYSPLFTDGAVSAAFGCANGQSVYAVYQNGEPVGVQDINKTIRVLEMAAETGNPVVTFYNSNGAKIEGGLELLNANSRLTAQIARISGVVPQIAAVIGTCAGTSAVQAAAADVCVMAKDAELFLNAPFNAEDKVKAAGTSEFAAKAGVAAVVVKDAAEVAATVSKILGLLPANNLAGPAVFDFDAPTAALNLSKYDAKGAAEAIADADSLVELYSGYGTNVYTALGTVCGMAVGIVATAKGTLCHKCTAKAARFVRLCDAYSIPVLTIVNTEGFVRSEGDDQAGGIRQAARMAGVYAEATTVKVAVLAGEAVGPIYTVFAASADWRIAVEGCTVAPLAPETAVTVLYKDEIFASDNIQQATREKTAKYQAEVCSASAAVANGAADTVAKPADVRSAAAQALDMLATKRAVRLSKKHGNITL
ncbi:MAG: carboxyl transferase domain-containing protein [Gemmiger sp.]|uniref:carboxyl transferase domain-containing protein n=1 Tax=Gemmiger sp. TaxID=2049027 RepID=UPI002E770AEB|nr:carboxyl transferase domain-containing protein [Gemmiger sp.]MEE0801375.1 carboxyl transferase domain-containing protein [Gemmiger sp.]